MDSFKTEKKTIHRQLYKNSTKVHLFLKQCLHNFHLMKTRSFSPNLSKLAPPDISWFHKLKKDRFKNEWILSSIEYDGMMR
jgi:hypothetical protein